MPKPSLLLGGVPVGLVTVLFDLQSFVLDSRLGPGVAGPRYG